MKYSENIFIIFAGLIAVLVSLLLLLHCAGGTDTGNPLAGGTGTGNPQVLAKIIGNVVDSSGTGQASVALELLPKDFNVGVDTQTTLLDTTDTQGSYRLEGTVDSGSYLLSGIQLSTGNRFFRRNIGISDSALNNLGVDTLRQAQSVNVNIPASLYVTGGMLYAPGTRISVSVDSAGPVQVDSVIVGHVDFVYYSPSLDSQIAAIPDSAIVPVSTADTNNVLKGQVLDSIGSMQSNVRVTFLPADFNPVKDSLYASAIDTADSVGSFEFIIKDTGSYVRTGIHLTNGTMIGLEPHHLENVDSSITLSADTLQPCGAVLAHVPGSLFVANGVLYIPGTEFHTAVDTPGLVILDSLPPGTTDVYYFDPAGDSLITTDSTFGNVSIASAETVFVGPDTQTTMPAYNWKGSWEAADGPYGGNVLCVAVNSSGDLFAGSYCGGVFSSTDNGQSWSQLAWPSVAYPPSYNKSVFAMATDTLGNVFAATSHNGVIRSTDGGSLWEATDLDSFACYSLTIIPNGHVFAGDGFGRIYRSMDNGVVWEEVLNLTSGSNNKINALVSGHIDTIFVGHGSAGVYMLLEHDSAFNMTIKPTMILSGADVRDFALISSSEAFAATSTNGVYFSNDVMNQWNSVNTGMSNLDTRALVRDANGNLFAGSNGGGIFRSIDSGTTWIPVNNGLDGQVVNSLVIKSSGEIVAGTDKGVFISSDNGSAWSGLSVGITGIHVAVLAASENGLFAGTLNDGLYRSTDQGSSWEQVYSTGDFSALFAGDNGTIFAGPIHSTDNGNTWVLGSGLTGFICSISMDSKGTLFAGNSTGNVFRSTDNGATWTSVASFASNFIEGIVVNSNDHVFAGTWSGEGVYRSIDGGDTWVNVGGGYSFGSISGMAITESDYLFTVSPGSISRSMDNGDSWQSVYTGEFGGSVNPIAIDLQDNIFVADKTGMVLLSSDSGSTWQEQTAGINNQWIRCFATAPNGRFFAGSEGGGVFRSVP